VTSNIWHMCVSGPTASIGTIESILHHSSRSLSRRLVFAATITMADECNGESKVNQGRVHIS
jgi:hypothetical protein